MEAPVTPELPLLKGAYLFATTLTVVVVLGAALVLIASVGLPGVHPLWQKIPLLIELVAVPTLLFLLLLGNVVGWFTPDLA